MDGAQACYLYFTVIAVLTLSRVGRRGANIQMRTLKTEVGKGSMSTAVGHGLVDPKRWGSSVSTCLIFQANHRKGIRLKFRNLDMDSSRQRN
ncbi:hypothetical protein FOB64_003979 [Candida albicans]|uniref:Uncharacterized protein n=1 Tax=Candida albicans TaxID=5476 RepID=A0A8H6C000_CANAX|nr:hypothetical protein FOB64_003979 [Candida albicans]